jgi:hypothetical protein
MYWTRTPVAGYQRRFNANHSLDFRKYIQQEKSSTIPLTINARERTEEHGVWSGISLRMPGSWSQTNVPKFSPKWIASIASVISTT